MTRAEYVSDFLDGVTETEAAELLEAVEISRKLGGVVVTVIADDGDMKNRAKEFKRLVKQYEETGAGIVMPDTSSPICFVAVPRSAAWNSEE